MTRSRKALLSAGIGALALSLASCGNDDAPGSNAPGAVPNPNPTATTVVRPDGQPDWNTVALTTDSCPDHVASEPPCLATQQFQVTDTGAFSISRLGRSGSLTEAELLRLDSRIDAIKEEALQPFTCVNEIQPAIARGESVSVTFENRPDAIVYRTRPARSEVCWSGDRQGVEALVSELRQLQTAHSLPTPAGG